VTFGDLISYAVIGFIAVRLVNGARVATSRDGRGLLVQVVTGVRWRHVWPVPLVLTVVVFAAFGLMEIPGLDWGWWSMLGGEGNPVFGSTESTAGTPAEWLIPAVFMLLLLPAIPLFAHAEERIFRRGAESWSWGRRAFKTLQFGLAHALIGIPIGAAIALSIGGAYFMSVYLRAFATTRSTASATMASTIAHAVYNTIIVSMVVIALIWTAVDSLGGT
jgi:hypothetical protein